MGWANFDATRFTASDFPSDSKVDGPTPPERNPLLREHSSLLFHLPKSKADELKRLATPAAEHGQTVSWISSYDVFSAIFMNQAALDQALAMLAPVRDKTCLFTRVNSFPPLTLVMNDWPSAAVREADFGFARPCAYRYFFDAVTEGLALVYPPHVSGSNSNDNNDDEGCEFVVTVENEIVEAVLRVPDFQKYF
ncbi:uncharacterized protein P884DRAFT_329856 [Thermothelomyces heterothallicus CBS 202.75]|uniref:uncharacterized protein n=1 Tax=Thermothelomyces heterothallicus CBS 202.75 TaxID=1149848 RepID=UPI003742021B